MARSENGKRLMQLLLEHRSTEIKISEEIIEVIVSNMGYVHIKTEIMQMLLDQPHAADFEITERFSRLLQENVMKE